MKKILTAVFLFFIGAALKAQTLTTLRIDPTYVRGAKVSAIFDSVKIIPLETTKESLFGRIDKLVVTDKYFIILDNSGTRSILIFTKEGKFHAKIKKHITKSKSQNSFDGYIGYFKVNIPKKEIEMVSYKDGKADKLNYYDFDGNKLREGDRIIYRNANYFAFPNLDTAYAEFFVNKKNKDSVSHEISIYHNNKLYKEYLPFNGKTGAPTDALSVNHSAFYKTNNDSLALYSRSYDYTITQWILP